MRLSRIFIAVTAAIGGIESCWTLLDIGMVATAPSPSRFPEVRRPAAHRETTPRTSLPEVRRLAAHLATTLRTSRGDGAPAVGRTLAAVGMA